MPVATGVAAPVAALCPDFTGDSWARGVADHAAGHEADRAEDNGTSETAEGGVGDTFMCVRGYRCENEGGGDSCDPETRFHLAGSL